MFGQKFLVQILNALYLGKKIGPAKKGKTEEPQAEPLKDSRSIFHG